MILLLLWDEGSELVRGGQDFPKIIFGSGIQLKLDLNLASLFYKPKCFLVAP
ncbi:unnamed protein product [Musa banksii]